MIDITKGRYWDLPWSLVSGCTPCSPGCERCWSASLAHRFGEFTTRTVGYPPQFTGQIQTHPERLSIPLKRRKPTVYAVWNDLFHEAVPPYFIDDAFDAMIRADQHIYLVLTKRPERLYRWADYTGNSVERILKANVYLGLTVCNQEEADAKIPVFRRVPGKKFLSIEPMLGPVDIRRYLPPASSPPCVNCHYCNEPPGCNRRPGMCDDFKPLFPCCINAVILGGETGPGARPMHPDWVRSVRDQCQSAGVPFFFKSWGAWGLNWLNDPKADFQKIPGSEWMDKGIKKPGRLLDGRTHDELPWVKT